jgi:hypothetical protein
LAVWGSKGKGKNKKPVAAPCPEWGNHEDEEGVRCYRNTPGCQNRGCLGSGRSSPPIHPAGNHVRGQRLARQGLRGRPWRRLDRCCRQDCRAGGGHGTPEEGGGPATDGLLPGLSGAKTLQGEPAAPHQTTSVSWLPLLLLSPLEPPPMFMCQNDACGHFEDSRVGGGALS